ncbi:hypothetical protein FACS189467_4670 [Bacteroidia bacterium]|nr:hypothetical protein FACS189467_4670 [Bacteroidia bacterium]
MKGKYIFTLSLLCVVLNTAFARKNADEENRVKIQLLSDSLVSTSRSGTYAYVLPRTVLRVKVEVERTQFIHGVYAEFAEKQLGIAGVKLSNRTNYLIRSIGVESMQEADPAQIYIVQSPDKNIPLSFFSMTQNGLVLSLPQPNNTTPSAVAWDANDWGIPPFSDMGFEIASPKLAKNVVFPDSNAVSENETTPLTVTVTNHSEVKGKEAQALEASKFLTQLRRRKFELITAEVEAAFASNEALKVALTEIKEMEQQYLELFIGKTKRSKTTYYYDVLPMSGTDRYPLFLFSPETGINTTSGHSITLHLQSNSANKHSTPHNEKAYRYRIPAIADLRITDEDLELFRGRYWIFQYGRLLDLPLINVE